MRVKVHKSLQNLEEVTKESKFPILVQHKDYPEVKAIIMMVASEDKDIMYLILNLGNSVTAECTESHLSKYTPLPKTTTITLSND